MGKFGWDGDIREDRFQEYSGTGSAPGTTSILQWWEMHNHGWICWTSV